MRSDILIKLYEGDDAFAILREEWQNLFAESAAGPFLAWEWASVWFEFFGQDYQPFLLAAYCNAQLIALLPLFIESSRILKMPLKKLAFIGAGIGGAAYLDALVRPGRKPEAMQAFRDFLNARHDIDIFELEGVAADSGFVPELFTPFERTNFRRRVVPYDVCQFAEVRGNGAQAEFLQRIFNDTARKKLKRLKKLPGFEFRRVTAPGEITGAFERFARLHDDNWTEKGGSEVTGHGRLIDFHQTAVAACAGAGTVFFDELWVENKCIAALYGFQRADAYFYYSSGFDEAYFKFSPMVALYNLSIQQGLENGVEIFDFLRGGQAYKTYWTTGTNNLVTVRLLRRRSVAAILSETSNRLKSTLRDWSISILPPDMLENIKAQRRRRKRNALWTASASSIENTAKL